MSDPILPCDHCGKPAPDRRMMCVATRSHVPDENGVAKPARVNMQRWWCFCSDMCRNAWYDLGDDADHCPVGPPGEPKPAEPCIDGDDHAFSENGDTIIVKAIEIKNTVISTSAICSKCGKSADELADHGGHTPHLIGEGYSVAPDVHLKMTAIRVTPEGDQIVSALHDEFLAATGEELNAYWKTPVDKKPIASESEPK